MRGEGLIIPLMFGIAALLLLASTNVVSFFQGSHEIVDISGNENDINCTSCHPQIADQLRHSAIHSNFKCEECHRLKKTSEGKVITYAEHNSSGIFVGNQSHAAYTPRCLDCHGGVANYYNASSGRWETTYYNDTWVEKHAPPAYPFNETNYGSDYSAHKKFVELSLNCDLCVGENEACLACHTNYSIELDYKYFWNISYTKYSSSWTLTNFNYNGTRTYEVNFTKTGAKHEFIALKDIDCISCHKNIYDALVNGTTGTPYNYSTHSPIEIDSDDYGGNTYGYWTMGGKDHDWPIDNYWGHTRYHYIPPSYRSQWVNSTYCTKCHNVAKYASEHPSDSTTYNLDSVVGDTNSTSVHAAEALRCTTCHGYGKTKDPYGVISGSGYWGNEDGHRAFMNQTENKARTFSGDLCMGCHEAAGHTAYESSSCDMCHNNYGYARCGGCHSDNYNYNYNININIESEPSGNVSRSY
ncbi:hypothetical protein [Archaeoglobus veneficus]|uniref:Uncharacterized protein n=1 Tax=Archaeoglobus veneficus (strain DSM 11195 / SNP6) TaxID=693661 RepID=F2KPF4_ARCVS|nr:hypothetical protein [Archaeoglobus veneficus]AEA46385.1 hypothetical protein Arcve_0352 [Archaeoglobus veneficus SNP6]